MRRFFLLGAVLLTAGLARGQLFLADSLKQVLQATRDEPARLSKLLILLDHANNFPADSVWNFVMEARTIAAKLNDDRARVIALVAAAGVYLRWGHQDSARALLTPELARYKPANASQRSSYFALAQAMVDCVDHDDNYKAAMPLVFSIIQDAERYKDSPVVANCMNTLAAWYYDLDLLAESRSWSYRALGYCFPERPETTDILIATWMVLGDNYRWVKRFDSAAYFINRSYELARREKDTYWMSSGLQRLSGLYLFEKKYDSAESNIRESLRLIQLVQGKEPQPDKWMFLASAYERSGRVDEVIRVMDDALTEDTFYRNHSPRIKKDNGETSIAAVNYYSELARCYHLKGDYRSYAETLEKVIEGNDVVYRVNEANAVAGYQAKYELEKKEATIARQQLTHTRDRYLLWGAIAAAIFIVIILLLALRVSRLRQQARIERLREEEKRRAQQAVSEAEENERKRIAADLHDNLGAQLSFIKRNVNFIMQQPGGFNRADEQRYLGYVNDTAQTAMIDLRETLWVLNKDQVTAQEFADKLKSYLRQQLLEKEQISWEFQEEIAVNPTLASGEVMHLFRIVQELISNVVKHSGARRIDIGFRSTGSELYRLHISDDGTGFDKDQVRTGHYGLENIERRVREIGAELQLNSRTGQGTEVILIKKITHMYQ